MCGFLELGVILTLLFSLPMIISYLWVIKICIFSGRNKKIVYDHHLFEIFSSNELLSNFLLYLKEKTTCALLLLLGKLYFIFVSFINIVVTAILLIISLFFYLFNMTNAAISILWFIIGVCIAHIFNLFLKILAEWMYEKK